MQGARSTDAEHGKRCMCHCNGVLQAQLQHDSTLRTLLSVYLPQHKLVSQAIKAQFNEGKVAADVEAGTASRLSHFKSSADRCCCRPGSMLPDAL